MRIELNGFVVTQLTDGRYHVQGAVEFIVDDIDDALEVIHAYGEVYA